MVKYRYGDDMKKTITLLKEGLTYQLRVLVSFEILYRLFGLFLLWPIVRYLFLLSLRMNGIAYLTNGLLYAYLTSFYTFIFIFVVGILLACYVLYELLVLNELFKRNYQKNPITLKPLLMIGWHRLKEAFKKHFFLLLIRATVFLILVEAIQVYGFFQNRSLPILFEQFIELKTIQTAIIVMLLVSFGLFLGTFYVIPVIEYEGLTSIKAIKRSFGLFLKKPKELVFGFILLNLIINGLLFITSALLLLSIGLVINFTLGSLYVSSVLLSIVYSLYVSIAFIGSMFIIPLHYAFVFTKYIQVTQQSFKKEVTNPFRFTPKGYLITLLSLLVLLPIINFSTFSNLIEQDRSKIELFNRPDVIAHRGASAYAPENTISAINEALLQNADGIEIDVRMSLDGILFLFHDSNVSRTTNITERIAVESFTYQALKALDAGSWFGSEFEHERIPTLEEVFEVTKGKTTLYIELKSNIPLIEENLITLLEAYEMYDEVVLMSFNRSQLQLLKSLSENKIKTLLLLPIFYGDIMDLVDSPNYDYLGFSVSMVKQDSAYVSILHQAGKRIYVWTVNNQEDIRSMSNYDVDGIITDDPLKALEIVLEDFRFSLFESIINLFER